MPAEDSLIAATLRDLGCPVTITPTPNGGWFVDDGGISASATGLATALQALDRKRKRTRALAPNRPTEPKSD
jgi:hypothetical protein